MLADHRARELLFRLLEARQLRVTRRALIDYHGEPGQHLLASGLLELAGYGSSILAPDEDETPIYTVVQDPDRGGLGYHSSSRGWVPVVQHELEFYRPCIALIFSCLLGDDLRSPKQGAISVEEDLLWEAGQLRLVKSELTTIWFARRLTDRWVQDKLSDANKRRPATGRRLILTSTSHDRLPPLPLEGSTIVPIDDVLDPYKSLKIDLSRLRGRLTGKISPAAHEPLQLSEDGSRLTILGTQIVFGGAAQRKAIRILVDAYRSGRRVNAAEALSEAGFAPGLRTFRQAFRKQYPLLDPFLKSSDQLWYFEL